jgi:multiple sugar transport system permease protein
VGAAIAFILFVIIIAFTLLQRWVLRDRPVSKRRIRAYQPRAAASTPSAPKEVDA